MELFTLGRGNYKENDIKEAARAFTGWGSIYRANLYSGDFNMMKAVKLFGKTGNFDGDDIIDILLQQRQTANLYR